MLWISKILGRSLGYSAIDKLIRRYARQAGLKDFSTHSIRRACATHMLHHGAHPVQIQMLLGHSTLKTLSRYLNVAITDMKKMHQKSKPGK